MDTKFKLSSYQEDILANIENTNSNLLVDAKAGSGKTSTLLLATECLNNMGKTNFTYLAFNKDIVNELKNHLNPASVDKVKTIHSLGFSFLASYLYKKYGSNYEMRLDMFGKYDKMTYLLHQYYDLNFRDRISAYYESDSQKVHSEIIDEFKTVCKFCKFNLVNFESQDDIEKILEEHTSSISMLMTTGFLTNAASLVNYVIREGIDMFMNPTQCGSDGKQLIPIDFDDMVYLPVILNLDVPYKIKNNVDTVFIDECQDLSKLQQRLVHKLNTRDNRFIFVGDKYQSIYGFNGADFRSISNIKKNFNTKSLPLNICYRCPAKIVELAREIVPDLKYNPDREDLGEIEIIDFEDILEYIRPNDVIIARYNRELVQIYKYFILEHKKRIKFKNVSLANSIKNGILSSIHGYLIRYNNFYNVEHELSEQIQKLKNDCPNMDKNEMLKEYKKLTKKLIKDFKTKSDKKIMKSNYNIDYLRKAMTEYKNKGAYNINIFIGDTDMTASSVLALNEYYDAILDFIDNFTKNSSSVLVTDFENYIKNLFISNDSESNVPLLGSIHSMKGDEANTIFIYNYPRYPYVHSAMNDDDKQQERNLQYVALTRAKHKLFLIKSTLKEEGSPDNELIRRNNRAVRDKVNEINKKFVI